MYISTCRPQQSTNVQITSHDHGDTMDTSNVPTLSPELIANIIRCFNGDSSGLGRLCLVSRAFNALATPLLYQAYRQGYRWAKREIGYFYAFLRTILQRPDLADHVKYLNVGRMDGDEPYHLKMDATLIELCEKKIDEVCSGWLAGSISDELRQQWIDLLESPFPYAVLTVLLYSVPHVETLFYEEGWKPDIFWKTFSGRRDEAPKY